MKNKVVSCRIPWIDMAKGYGIILVIYDHLGMGPLYTWICSFHLPLFFFLSGYVFGVKYDFKDFLVRKFKSIIVPYFSLGVPVVILQLLKYAVHDQVSLQKVFDLFKQFVFQQRLWALWFLTCLFCLNIFFYFIVKVCKTGAIILITSIILAILGVLYYENGGKPWIWNADVCLTAMPFFAVGYLYKLNNKKLQYSLEKNRSCYLIMFSILVVVNILTWRLSLDENGIGLEMFKSNYGNPIFTYIAAFSGIFFVVIFSKWKTIKPIQYIGENSIIFYAWHQPFAMPLVSKCMLLVGLGFMKGYGLLGAFTYKVICVIGILLVLTVVNYVVKICLKHYAREES